MSKGKFTIFRSQWLRGEGASFSALLRRSDQKRCCLGFLCQHLGIKDEVLLGKEAPGSLLASSSLSVVAIEKLLLGAGLVDQDGKHTVKTKDLMEANDFDATSDRTKEENITTLLGELGFEVEFI